MAKNLIDESKAWLPYFYKDGKWDRDPDIKFNGRAVSDEAKRFMYDFFKFLIESTFLNKCTVIWLNSNLSSMQKAFEFYNSQSDEIDAVNTKTAITNVDYDKKKLKKYFDKDLLFNIMAYPEENLPNAIEVLDTLNRKYFNDKEYKASLVIKLPIDNINKKLTEEKFEALIKMLKRYSRKVVKEIEDGKSAEFTPEMIGYFNYLISCKQLNSEESTRLNEINEILGISGTAGENENEK